MNFAINKVAVLGAGVMGSGIAAHLANAGVPCLLLDRVPTPGPKDDPSARAFRNGFAREALVKLGSAKPAPLASAAAASLIDRKSVV